LKLPADKEAAVAKLTAKTRKKIPGKDFAGPDRSYPIENESHARNALARASGKSVEGKVDAAVHRKYPGIGKPRGKRADKFMRTGK
jgi:hypothetical protein